MASIETRTSKNGTVTWRVKWRQGGKQQSETLTTPKRAKAFRGMVDAAGQRWPENWVPGFGLVEATTSDLTVKEWCTRAIDAKSGIEERTRQDYHRSMRLHLGKIGPMRLDQLTREDVGTWVTKLKLSPKSVKNIHGTLSSCLTAAVRDGHIVRNPAKGVGLPRTDGPDTVEMVPLSDSDIALLVSSTVEHYRPLVELLAETGLRWSEASALQVRHVDVFDLRVKVGQAWKRQEDGSMQLGPPKTRRANRSVVISERLRDLLLPLLAGRGGAEFLFTTPTGRVVRHGNFRSRVWLPAIRKAQRCKEHQEVKDPCGCHGTLTVTPRVHDLRHAHASKLIVGNVPLVKVQRRLGHESIQTTIDTYGHLRLDADEEIRAVIAVQPQSLVSTASAAG